MPIDYRNYAPDWSAISAAIRERAGNRCEWPGCNLPNGAFILRSLEDAERYLILRDDGIYYTPDGWPVRLSEMPEEFGLARIVKVVLTVAHLDHDILHNDPDNLRCWCQLHHLRWDAQYHAKNARVTRLRKQEERRAERGEVRLF
jgi:hypothetical protein